jgi:hypothetical protein
MLGDVESAVAGGALFLGRLFVLVDVRFCAHNGLTTDIALCPESQKPTFSPLGSATPAEVA